MTAADAGALAAAIGAAAAFAVGNVAEMRAARRTSVSDDLHVRLLARLVRNPLWLAGMAATVVGYGLQATALYLAPVMLVQPLIVAELLFALPLAARLAGVRLGRREWLGALTVTAGIAVFVAAAGASGESSQVSTAAWSTMTGLAAAAVVVAAVLAHRTHRRPMLRATALAAGSSVCFGFLAVQTKIVGHQFAEDKVRALTHPQLWLLGTTACAGLLLAQTAFKIAPLSVSLPVIDIGEPLVASAVAVVALHEHLAHGAGAIASAALGAGLCLAGLVALDTSPLVRTVQRNLHTSDANGRTAPPCGDRADALAR